MRFCTFFTVALLSFGAPAAHPISRSIFLEYMLHSKVVPPDLKAELAVEDSSGSPSCQLVDWLLRHASSLPSRVKTFGETLRPACQLPVTDIRLSDAESTLREKRLAVTISGSVITVLQRSEKVYALHLCCSLQGPMSRLGSSDIWAARYRLDDLDRAMLTLVPDDGNLLGTVTYRGPNAPKAPDVIDLKPSSPVISDTLYSVALGETRRLQIYIPDDKPPKNGWPVLFLADGGVADAVQIEEALVRTHRISPIAIIGIVSGQRGIVEDRSILGIADLRAADDLRGFPGGNDRFERHMTFLSRELVSYVRATYGITSDRTKIAITGTSNGGQLAFEAGVMHPEVFGVAIPRSAGWTPVMPDPNPAHERAKFLASAGLYEAPFLQSTSSSVSALRAAGYQVDFTCFAAGHATDQWDIALANALTATFSVPRSVPHQAANGKQRTT